MAVTERGTGSGLDKAGLLRDLKVQVKALEDDLRARTESVEEYRVHLEGEYARAVEAERTAMGYGPWRDARVTQSAVAWVLGCVFVRFCEDNRLIDEPFIAGPGERLQKAAEAQEAFFWGSPESNDRDWLTAAFKHLAGTNETAAGLFDERHNPLWELRPGYEAATELLRFWRQWGPDNTLLYDFTDPEWDTRFLGDLYQDLSEDARKTYALLQTPEFVEEFILDLTLEPAIEEFGLNPEWEAPGGGAGRGLRTIDPACGSGHFLLGIFGRLVKKWRDLEPGTDDWTIVTRALDSVHGCDKNPFAASVARFRLLVAAMREGGSGRLAGAPAFGIHVAVGDSLLHGRGASGIQTDLGTLFAEKAEDGASDGGAFAYSTEDVKEYADRVDLLGRGSYHVVVGNPPYITVKDEQEKRNYRKAYDACAGQYALSVPFAQQLFWLAAKGAGGTAGGGGYVGQITANSFMKREFGRRLIEEFFSGEVELSHIIDASGVYIPGHGTPTVILVGRNRVPSPRRSVRAVLGVRGEPQQPVVAADGLVWNAIISQVQSPGSDSEWVTVEDSDRFTFSRAPWSLSGGGAGQLMARVEGGASGLLRSVIDSIGFLAVTREDDAYMVGLRTARRKGISANYVRRLLAGTDVRDWGLDGGTWSIFPYDDGSRQTSIDPVAERLLWPNRILLKLRRALSGTQEEQGLEWFEYSSFSRVRYWSKSLISFAFVATHNNFSLRRGGEGFIRTAPVIKLPEGAGEDEHLELLGVLNSSTACFWLKQVSHDKGSQGVNEGFKSQEWERFYEFTGTKLKNFPLPDRLPLELGRALDGLAQELARVEPSAVCREGIPSRVGFQEAKDEYTRIRERMISLQEELDWQVYGLYGLLRGEEASRVVSPAPDPKYIPGVKLGERAFEIVLARKKARAEVETAWFERHGSVEQTQVPADWPERYREVVKARIATIEASGEIELIERPECKRRWLVESWEKRERAALRAWLLDRCERRELWFEARRGMEQPRVLTVNQLADALRDDVDFCSVAQLYAADHLGKPDLALAQVLAEVVADEHVPFLAALRYKATGLRKRAEWESVWEQQREEDRTGQRLDIKVPPKYTGADFLRHSYWSNRGKLDVPKERFVSYPGMGPEGDPGILLGWAGWDHQDQAQALINVIEDRTEQDGWGGERLVPLLAGLQEVLPWVRQWHGEFDAEWEGVPAEDIEAYFDEQVARHGVGLSDLKVWRPETRRGPKPAPKKAAESATRGE